MIFILQIIMLSIFLTILHEVGHLLASKMLRLKLQGFGIKFKPIPHFFVAIKYPKSKTKHYLYLFSGFVTYLILLIITFSSGLFKYKVILFAFAWQAIIETNPFYSDFVISKIVQRNYAKMKIKKKINYPDQYRRLYNEYMYSNTWYFHFILWTFFVFGIINLIH